ncbi:MAG: DNA polymerase III subunit gamma/tau [Planctomycetes bacterium]|nr:DNA polymerase III subunit gamma/tau [Planctomycetota bacterium]
MSYLVLARKYRPRTFAEVCAQEVAVRTLQNAIQEGRIGHAYLLCGPRGTGKTTTARIFAKALNCERGPTPEPCGVCERCTSTDSGAEIDIIEIDAASNRGIDDVRILRDEVAYAPLKARFKVYIVDEVHMLTTQAFNALLKTLEEPPSHVKFVFATTEAEKVPETIRSRCQILKLTLLTEEKIASRLTHVLGEEHIQVAPGVVEEVAQLARGSLRDALSITDQLLALSGSNPTVEDVRRLAGAGGPERVEAVLGALEKRDKAEVLGALAQADGSEAVLLDALLEHLRGALVALHCGERSQLFQTEASEQERRLARAQRLGSERLELWLFELVGTRARMQELPTHARLLLELTLLDLCRMDAAIPLAELCERLAALEERLARGGPATAAPSGVASSVRPAPTMPATPATPVRSTAGGATPLSSAPVNSGPGGPAASASAPAPASPPSASPSVARPLPSPQGASATVPRPVPAPAPTVATKPPPLATRELRPVAPPRAGTVSNAGAWATLVAELRAADPALGEALGRTGKLVDVGSTSARVHLTKLRDGDRERLLTDATRAACEPVLTRLFGRALRVVFEDATQRPPGERDAFTRSVAELFGGNIEDNA